MHPFQEHHITQPVMIERPPRKPSDVQTSEAGLMEDPGFAHGRHDLKTCYLIMSSKHYCGCFPRPSLHF